MTSTSSAATPQQFCVRWNSHLGSLGAAFPQLLAGQRFVDVTLACEGHQVHCHRLVLAACSTYFESLLGENPCKHPIIILPRDIRLWEIQALVDFMYKGEVNVSQAGLADLLKCAEILQIRGLCGTDVAFNLNQLTQMGAGSVKKPTTTSTQNSTNAHHNSSAVSKAASELVQQSLLSSALTATTPQGTSGGKLVTNILNKTTAKLSANNETNSSPRNYSQVPNDSSASDVVGRRKSERKTNHQQKIDNDLVLDNSNDDIEIKCEDLIIDEDELLKEHNVTTDDCDDEDMDDNEKMNEEENFQNFHNPAEQQPSPTMSQPNENENDEENEISLPLPSQTPNPVLKTYTNKKATQQTANSSSVAATTPSTSTTTKSSHLKVNCGSIRVKSNENLFENYDKQIKISSAGTVSTAHMEGGGGKAGAQYVLNDYQIIRKSGKLPVLPASLKFNRKTMEILLKPVSTKGSKKNTTTYTIQEDDESEAGQSNSNNNENGSDYENIICAPSFDEITGGYDDPEENDEDLSQYYEDIEHLQNECDNEDYDFPTNLDDYDEQNEDGDVPPPLVPFGEQSNSQGAQDLKPFMFQTPSVPMKFTNKTLKYVTGRPTPYSASSSNNNLIMTQRQKNEVAPSKNNMLEKLLANGGGRPPVAFVLRSPRGNQPRSYTTDALWAALMDVKSGESIYRASQIHKVPRKTLRNWMKRWDIKSAYPMPRQLQQAAERKKLIRDSMMLSTATDTNEQPTATSEATTSSTTSNSTFSITLH